MATDDRARILQAELQKNQQNFQTAAGADKIRIQDNIRSLQREIANLPKSSPVNYGSTPPAQSKPAATPAQPAASAAARTPVDPGISDQFGDILSYITGQANALKTSTADQVAAASEAANASYGVAQQVAGKTYQADQVKAGIRKQAGLDAADPSNLAASTLQQLAENDVAYEAEKARYDEMASANLLESPIDWILSRVFLPSQAAKVNALAAKDSNLQSKYARNVAISTDAQEHVKLDTAATDYALNLQDAMAKFNDARAKVAGIATESAKAGLSAGSMMLMGSKEALIAPYQVKLAQQQVAAGELGLGKKEAEAAQARRTGAAFGYPEGIPREIWADLDPKFSRKIEEFGITGVAEPRVFVDVGKPLANDDLGAIKYNTARISDKQLKATAMKIMSDQQKQGNKVTFDQAYDTAWQGAIEDATTGLTSVDKPKQVNGGGVQEIHDATSKYWDQAFNPLRADVAGFMRTNAAAINAGQPTPVPQSNIMQKYLATTGKAGVAVVNEFGLMSTPAEKSAILAVTQGQVHGRILGATGKPADDAQVAREIAQFYTAAVKYTTARNGAEQIGYRVPDNYVARLPMPEYSLLSGVHSAGGFPVDLRNPASIQEYLAAYRKAEQTAKSSQEAVSTFGEGLLNTSSLMGM